MKFNVLIPKTTSELLSMICAENEFRFGAGYTDLLLELRKKPVEDLTIINLSQIQDEHLTGIHSSSKGRRMGAMFTANNIVHNDELKKALPVLHQAALSLASTQIRQVATIGGNLCTASPSGDIACAFTALEADCEIISPNGKKKTLPITDFFSGVRKTILKKDEVLYGITVPEKEKTVKELHSRFIKVGTRRSMECSVVSLAYHFQTDETGKIIHAGVAIGASAPTIRFAGSACEFLMGKSINNISESEREEFAQKVVSYASPITDIRATAWYRKEVLFNISRAIFE